VCTHDVSYVSNSREGLVSTSSNCQVAQPEGIVVSPLDSSFLYLGGINSTTMAVINVSEFWEPRVVELRTGAGAQLVS